VKSGFLTLCAMLIFFIFESIYVLFFIYI